MSKKQLPAFAECSKVLLDLTAVSSSRLDEPDYERRTNGFRACAELVVRTQWLYTPPPASPTAAPTPTTRSSQEQSRAERPLHTLVYALLHALYDEEFAVRGHSVRALQALISAQVKWSELCAKTNAAAASAPAVAADTSSNKKKSKKAADTTMDTKHTATPATSTAAAVDSKEAAADSALPRTALPAPPVLTQLLYPALRQGFKAQSTLIRNEHLLLLGHLIRSYPTHYAAYQVLVDDTNEDTDMLKNIAHIQAHRRRKAWQRLQLKCAEGRWLSLLLCVLHLFPSESTLPFRCSLRRGATECDCACADAARVTCHLRVTEGSGAHIARGTCTRTHPFKSLL